MFDHTAVVMRALAKEKSQWKGDFYFTMKFTGWMLSKCYAKVIPTTGMLLIRAHILSRVQKLQSFRKWDNGMDINTKDETSYTTQYWEAFLRYVENEYCAKHRRLPILEPKIITSNNLFSSARASRSGQSSYDWYDLSMDHEEYWMPQNVAETTPRESDLAALLVIAARLCLNSSPELIPNWVQIDHNVND